MSDFLSVFGKGSPDWMAWPLLGTGLAIAIMLAITHQTVIARFLLVPLALTAALFSERPRLVATIAVTTLGVLMVAVLGQGPQIAGDGIEYYQTLVCLANHGTPDLRVGDLEKFHEYAAADGLAAPPDTGNYYVLGRGGRRYGYHFWAYEAAALMPMALLSALGLGHLAALQFTNCLLFVLAWWMLLRHSAYDPARRRAFALLWFASPVLAYVRWPNPEIFTASLVIIAVVLTRRGVYSWAALCAALASTQNPPVVLVVGLILALAALQAWRNRDAYQLVPTAAAASIALLPTVFNYLALSTANPITATYGITGFLQAISLHRTADLFFDLNMGLLPFLPALMLLLLVTPVLAAAKRGNWLPSILITMAVAMASLTSIMNNWNSATEGIMRYGTWILPLLIWAVVEGSEPSRPLERRLLAAAVSVQVVFVAFAVLPGITVPIGQLQAGYLRHGPVARFVLEHAPALYSPEPDTFTERTLGAEVPFDDDSTLPVIYASDGLAFKVLVRPSNMPALAQRLGTTAAALEATSRSAHHPDLVYVSISGGLPLAP